MPGPLHNVVVFSLAGRGYAVELRWVREVVTLGHVTPMPLAPAGIAGLVNARGAILPVLRLGALLGEGDGGASARAGDSALVVEVETARAAIRVDAIDEVSSLPPGGEEGTLLDSRGREVVLLRPPALLRQARNASEEAARTGLGALVADDAG